MKKKNRKEDITLVDEELLAKSTYRKLTYQWGDKSISVEEIGEYDASGCYENYDYNILEDESDELTSKEKKIFEKFLSGLK